MKAFLVSVNGKKVCLAGVAQGVLTASVTHLASADDLEMEVGGMTAESMDQLIWASQSIGVGDELTIKIVEADTVDQPGTMPMPLH
jgi:hypothetical protein